MKDRKKRRNILIFPSGSENGLDIYDSLKYNIHFNTYGATSVYDYSEFIYPKEKLYIGNLYITNDSFINEFNKVLDKFEIDFIIPTHDTIALYLIEHKNIIKAEIVSSPYETAKIAENKKLIYESLESFDFCPKIYWDNAKIDEYPVFAKPKVSAGGKGTAIVKDEDELKEVLNKNEELLITEYLPGTEYTIDCFTNKNRKLIFVGPRIRERAVMGISFRASMARNDNRIYDIANKLNEKFKFRGSWFFQLKEDNSGNLKLMEFSIRHAGTMTFYRQTGINFALLSLFDRMGYDVKVIFNDYDLILERRIKSSFKLEYEYKKVYIDFDDTLIVNNKINTELIKFIYQCINKNKEIILITKHEYDLNKSLKKYRINKDLFNEIIFLDTSLDKADYISKEKSIFIDNYFFERLAVKEKCSIPVFDVDAVECLLEE